MTKEDYFLSITQIFDKKAIYGWTRTMVNKKDPADPACKAVRDLQRSVRTSGIATCRYLLCYDNMPAALIP
jgi:hypothetical protein